MEDEIVIPRTIDAINQDYSKCATLLGDKFFRVQLLQAEIQALQNRMHELNKESSELSSHPPVDQL